MKALKRNLFKNMFACVKEITLTNKINLFLIVKRLENFKLVYSHERILSNLFSITNAQDVILKHVKKTRRISYINKVGQILLQIVSLVRSLQIYQFDKQL